MTNVQKTTYIPTSRIYPNRITNYYVSEYGKSQYKSNANSLKNLENNKPKTEISNNAKKRIRQAINWLYALSNDKLVTNPSTGKKFLFRLNFITLTLASQQMHDDNYIKKNLLNKFLEHLRYNYEMKSYVWKAESQKNGNIHFHITTNKFIHYLEIRNIWNKLQNKHGYIDAFEIANGHRNPNSTDVHSIRKIKNLAGYMATYMTKNPTYRPIDGRQWFLSQSLTKVEGYEDITCGSLHSEIENLILEKSSKFFAYDYSSVLYADIFSLNKSQYPTLSHIANEIKCKYSFSIN